MPLPIHIQDMLMKIPLIQEVVDRMVGGEERSRSAHQQYSARQLEREREKRKLNLEERAGLRPTDSESGSAGKREAKRRKKKTKRAGEPKPTEEYNDLRRRKEEDDADKGQKIDING